ncbi:unnamed protein product [Gadus morhua 'NCC']
MQTPVQVWEIPVQVWDIPVQGCYVTALGTGTNEKEPLHQAVYGVFSPAAEDPTSETLGPDLVLKNRPSEVAHRREVMRRCRPVQQYGSPASRVLSSMLTQSQYSKQCFRKRLNGK